MLVQLFLLFLGVDPVIETTPATAKWDIDVQLCAAANYTYCTEFALGTIVGCSFSDLPSGAPNCTSRVCKEPRTLGGVVNSIYLYSITDLIFEMTSTVLSLFLSRVFTSGAVLPVYAFCASLIDVTMETHVVELVESSRAVVRLEQLRDAHCFYDEGQETVVKLLDSLTAVHTMGVVQLAIGYIGLAAATLFLAFEVYFHISGGGCGPEGKTRTCKQQTFGVMMNMRRVTFLAALCGGSGALEICVATYDFWQNARPMFLSFSKALTSFALDPMNSTAPFKRGAPCVALSSSAASHDCRSVISADSDQIFPASLGGAIGSFEVGIFFLCGVLVAILLLVSKCRDGCGCKDWAGMQDDFIDELHDARTKAVNVANKHQKRSIEREAKAVANQDALAKQIETEDERVEERAREMAAEMIQAKLRGNMVRKAAASNFGPDKAAKMAAAGKSKPSESM